MKRCCGLFSCGASRGQLCVFLLLFLGYAVAYLSKRSASAWISHVLPAGSTIAEAGLFSSKFEFLTGLSKVGCGFLVDAYSASAILGGSLLLVGLVHPLVLLPSSAGAKSNVWGLNGFVQAFAWPALARVFLAWFPDPAKRGKWYAALAMSQNFGAMVAPVLLPALGAHFGWEANLLVPGVAAGLMALAIFALVSDAPPLGVDAGKGETQAALVAAASGADAGKGNAAPPRTPARVAAGAARAAVAAGGNSAIATPAAVRQRKTGASPFPLQTPSMPPPPQAPSASPPAPALSLWASAVFILSSPAMWLLGLNYFLNTLARNALTETPGNFLGKGALNVSAAAAAGAPLAYEVGAAIGGFAAGYFSDRLSAGRRGPYMALASFAMALPLIALLYLGGDGGGGGDKMAAPSLGNATVLGGDATDESTATILSHGGFVNALIVGAYGVMGFASFGPHVLNGLVTREVSHPSAQSSAGGFTKFIGTLGGAAAGAPLGWLMDTYGWRASLSTIAAASVLAGFVMLPLWGMRSYEEERKAAAAVAEAAAAVAVGGSGRGSDPSALPKQKQR